MKTILLSILFMAGIGASFGQKKEKITIQPSSDIQIDADLAEWDTLCDVADEGFWSYQLGQDAAHVYVAVCVEDVMLQSLAARNGILFSVVSNKKNRGDIQFLFPYPDAEVKRAMLHEDHIAEKDIKTDLISRSRGYFVRGFPTVPPGLLSLENSYGLQAKARIQDGKLYYEAVIPKELLDYTEPAATIKLAINDGFTTMVTARDKAAARSQQAYNPYGRRSTAKAKNKVTMSVLLETTLN